MRILDKGGVALDFARLGFEADTLKTFLDVLMLPHGILHVTGPAGSGTTATASTAADPRDPCFPMLRRNVTVGGYSQVWYVPLSTVDGRSLFDAAIQYPWGGEAQLM